MMRLIPQEYPQYVDEDIIHAPHGAFFQFFEWFDIEDAKKHINHWVKTVYKSASWSLGAPGDLLYFYECLIQLVEGAWLINQSDNNPNRLGNIAALTEQESFDIMNPDNYCGSKQQTLAFNLFPKNLSYKEFINPYRVYERFFKYRRLREWKADLYDMLKGSLANHDMEHMGTNFDLVSIKKHLDKLIEASNLIFVREFIMENSEWKEKNSCNSSP